MVNLSDEKTLQNWSTLPELQPPGNKKLSHDDLKKTYAAMRLFPAILFGKVGSIYLKEMKKPKNPHPYSALPKPQPTTNKLPSLMLIFAILVAPALLPLAIYFILYGFAPYIDFFASLDLRFFEALFVVLRWVALNAFVWLVYNAIVLPLSTLTLAFTLVIDLIITGSFTIRLVIIAIAMLTIMAAALAFLLYISVDP